MSGNVAGERRRAASFFVMAGLGQVEPGHDVKRLTRGCRPAPRSGCGRQGTVGRRSPRRGGGTWSSRDAAATSSSASSVMFFGWPTISRASARIARVFGSNKLRIWPNKAARFPRLYLSIGGRPKAAAARRLDDEDVAGAHLDGVG